MAGLAKKVRARPAAARRACAGAQKLRVCRVVPGLQFGACAKAGRAVGRPSWTPWRGVAMRQHADVAVRLGVQVDGEATGAESKIRITLTTSKSVANLEKVSARAGGGGCVSASMHVCAWQVPASSDAGRVGSGWDGGGG